MIVKLTEEENDLFTLLETPEEHEWYTQSSSQPLSLQIIAYQHMYLYTKSWNQENIGNYMWFHTKTHLFL